MMKNKAPSKSYCRYELIQNGTLPLRPGGGPKFFLEHRCSVVLVWPEGELPTSENTILTDPCFTAKGLKMAHKRLRQLNISFSDLRRFFLTHNHADHWPRLYYNKENAALLRFEPETSVMPAPVEIRPCPGHSPDLHCLVFWDADEGKEVWIAGDAVLDREWLEAWMYYWPNNYTPSEIAQTWRSVAYILSNADIVIPGHGDPIAITPELIEQLAASFPSAPYARQAAGVEQILRERLEKFK